MNWRVLLQRKNLIYLTAVVLLVLIFMFASINTQIALALLVMSVVAIANGAILLWGNRSNLREWPVCAGVAMAGTYIVPGLVFLQIVIFRVYALPWPIGPYDRGTSILRWLGAAVMIGFFVRAAFRDILTEHDRRRNTVSRT